MTDGKILSLKVRIVNVLSVMFSLCHSSFGGQLRRRRQVIGMLTFLLVFCRKGSCPIPLSISFLLWLPMRVPDSHCQPSGKNELRTKTHGASLPSKDKVGGLVGPVDGSLLIK